MKLCKGSRAKTGATYLGKALTLLLLRSQSSLTDTEMALRMMHECVTLSRKSREDEDDSHEADNAVSLFSFIKINNFHNNYRI